jgi:hypothetical protein
MKIIKVEEWEQNHINSLTLNLILYATIATLVATLLSLALKNVNIPQAMPELLFAPWSVALVLGTTVAFHKGVMAERDRAEQEKGRKEKK